MMQVPERYSKIISLATPIVLAMVSQNVLNLIDTAMIGRLGAKHLAATGLAGMVVFLAFSPALGVTSAVQAISSRLKGAGEENKLAYSLNSGLLFALITGVLIFTACLFIAEPLFALLNQDPEIQTYSTEYFLIRVAAGVFVIGNYAFRGYFNAVNQASIYLSTLVVMHVTNIVLNYLLIFGNFGFPRLEVKGAALATALSIVLGTVVYFTQALFKASKAGFLMLRPKLEDLWQITKISIPSGMELFFTMSNVVALYWLIGMVSAEALAGLNILMNIFLVILLPALGLGITLGILSGQALGRKDQASAQAWGYDVMKLGIALFVILAIPFIFFPKTLIGIFVDSEQVVQQSYLALRIMGCTIGFEMLGFTILEALKSLGETKQVLKISFTLQWLFFFPACFIAVKFFDQGLLAVWILQMGTHLLQSIVSFRLWNKKELFKLEL